jgi:toxin HigB-1
VPSSLYAEGNAAGRQRRKQLGHLVLNAGEVGRSDVVAQPMAHHGQSPPPRVRPDVTIRRGDATPIRGPRLAAPVARWAALSRPAVARQVCYSNQHMIRSLADDTTKDIWNGVNSKAARRIPRAIWPVIQRKLDQIDSVTTLDALRIPSGNRLHRLVDELAGFHAIRVNDQYRIIFRFEGEHAFDVRCADYH